MYNEIPQIRTIKECITTTNIGPNFNILFKNAISTM